MKKRHSTQETLIDETCAFPKFLGHNCHPYEHMCSSLCKIAILRVSYPIFCRAYRIAPQSTSQSANFHGAKAIPALNINCVRSQFRERHGFFILGTCVFLSFLQDLRDWDLVVRLRKKLFVSIRFNSRLTYTKIADAILIKRSIKIFISPVSNTRVQNLLNVCILN